MLVHSLSPSLYGFRNVDVWFTSELDQSDAGGTDEQNGLSVANQLVCFTRSLTQQQRVNTKETILFLSARLVLDELISWQSSRATRFISVQKQRIFSQNYLLNHQSNKKLYKTENTPHICAMVKTNYPCSRMSCRISCHTAMSRISCVVLDL